jgi:hypothetical protein
LKHLSNRTDLDDSQRATVASLSAKLRKARALYRDRTKQMQQKIAQGLFGSNNKQSSSSNNTDNSNQNSPIDTDTPKETQTDAANQKLDAVKEEQVSNKPSSIDNSSNVATGKADVNTTNQQSTESAAAKGKSDDKVNSVIDNYSGGTASKASNLNPNMIFLLATSLAVLLFSLIMAQIYKHK